MPITDLTGLGLPSQLANVVANLVGINTGLSGTFTCNGATNVLVTNTNIAAGDQVIITLNTVGGTVGAVPSLKTRTNGASFNVSGTAGDTSTYDYRILKA